jgi:hypothetical protein
MNIARLLWRDEAGFVISAELVLVATLVVVGLVVGLAEVQSAIVSELNDVGDAIGSLNQSYFVSGSSSRKGHHGFKAFFAGSSFRDSVDNCDNNQCDLDCDRPTPEGPKRNHHH